MTDAWAYVSNDEFTETEAKALDNLLRIMMESHAASTEAILHDETGNVIGMVAVVGFPEAFIVGHAFESRIMDDDDPSRVVWASRPWPERR